MKLDRSVEGIVAFVGEDANEMGLLYELHAALAFGEDLVILEDDRLLVRSD